MNNSTVPNNIHDIRFDPMTYSINVMSPEGEVIRSFHGFDHGGDAFKLLHELNGTVPREQQINAGMAWLARLKETYENTERDAEPASRFVEEIERFRTLLQSTDVVLRAKQLAMANHTVTFYRQDMSELLQEMKAVAQQGELEKFRQLKARSKIESLFIEAAQEQIELLKRSLVHWEWDEEFDKLFNNHSRLLAKAELLASELRCNK